jgi:hypothetical protein
MGSLPLQLLGSAVSVSRSAAVPLIVGASRFAGASPRDAGRPQSDVGPTHGVTLAPKTRKHYTSLHDHHIAPTLGQLQLRAIRAEARSDATARSPKCLTEIKAQTAGVGAVPYWMAWVRGTSSPAAASSTWSASRG